jgi:hypothetical protein
MHLVALTGKTQSETQNKIRRANKTQSAGPTKHNQDGQAKHNQERRPGSSTRGLADCVQVVSIGAVPATVVILYVGAMTGDGRQKAEEQK